MTDFVQFQVDPDDSTQVLFETADSDLVRQHGDAEPTEGGLLGDKIASAAEAAQAISRTLRERLTPDELTLELGLKVSGQANWFVAKAQTEGNVKVTLKWKNGAAPSSEPAATDAASSASGSTSS